MELLRCFKEMVQLNLCKAAAVNALKIISGHVSDGPELVWAHRLCWEINSLTGVQVIWLSRVYRSRRNTRS